MNIADLVIHVHPELDVEARKSLERKLTGHAGIDCAEFNHHATPHALLVKYDPDAIDGIAILQIVRQVDPQAAMAGL